MKDFKHHNVYDMDEFGGWFLKGWFTLNGIISL